MSTLNRFDEVLEAIEKLPAEDQQTLIEIVERRRIAQRRAELIADVLEARQEHQTGGCKPRSASDLMNEILS